MKYCENTERKKRLVLPGEINKCFTEQMTFDLGHKGHLGFCQTLRQGEPSQAEGKTCAKAETQKGLSIYWR